jgi:L-lactate dehydrogenase complex protein LldE
MRVGLFIPCYMDAFEPEVGVVRAVQEPTFELTDFLHDVLKVSNFPWARFLHKIGLHYNCNSLRGINLASPSEIKVAPFSKRYTAPEACGH